MAAGVWLRLFTSWKTWRRRNQRLGNDVQKFAASDLFQPVRICFLKVPQFPQIAAPDEEQSILECVENISDSSHNKHLHLFTHRSTFLWDSALLSALLQRETAGPNLSSFWIYLASLSFIWVIRWLPRDHIDRTIFYSSWLTPTH